MLASEDEEEEVEPQQGLINVLSGVGLAAAVLVLVFQLMLAQVWIGAEDNPNAGDWMQLLD